jgi:hypothetical protein
VMMSAAAPTSSGGYNSGFYAGPPGGSAPAPAYSAPVAAAPAPAAPMIPTPPVPAVVAKSSGYNSGFYSGPPGGSAPAPAYTAPIAAAPVAAASMVPTPPVPAVVAKSSASSSGFYSGPPRQLAATHCKCTCTLLRFNVLASPRDVTSPAVAHSSTNASLTSTATRPPRRNCGMRANYPLLCSSSSCWANQCRLNRTLRRSDGFISPASSFIVLKKNFDASLRVCVRSLRTFGLYSKYHFL